MGSVEDSWPFSLASCCSAPERSRLERIALQANAEYVERFVEGHGLCPYAKDGRRRGETRRYVHFQSSHELTELVELFRRIANDESQVVAQVIFPGLDVSPQEWIDFGHRITRLGHEGCGGHDVLANAALHPHLPYHSGSAFSLIPLFRRAPDPTIQWVRLEYLERLYEGRSKGSTFVDPAEILAALSAPQVKSLYDRVAEVNRQTAERIGVAQLEQALMDVHRRAVSAYRAAGEEG